MRQAWIAIICFSVNRAITVGAAPEPECRVDLSGGEARERIRYFGGIVFHQDSILAVPDQLRDAAGIARNHGHAVGHGEKDTRPESLRASQVDQRTGAGQIFGEVAGDLDTHACAPRGVLGQSHSLLWIKRVGDQNRVTVRNLGRHRNLPS